MRRPNDLPLSLADIGRSVGLAILLLALLGLPARVFNATTKTHRREFQKWLATLRTRLPAVAPAAVRKLGGIAAVSAVIATGVHAFLNPGFPTRAGSGAFALGMLLGWAVIVLNCVVSWRVYVARYASHATGRWHVYTGQIGVSMLCVAVSRLGHFVPGLMLGMAGDYETYNRIELEHQARRIALTATTLAAVSLIAWGLSVPVGDAATHPNASFLTLTLDATVSVVAVAGMETLLFTLIPLQFLDGHVLMSWRPRLWLALWGGGALWFSLVVLNPALSHPEGTAHGATRVSVGWLASLLGAEMIIAMGLWTFFALRKRTAQRPASPA